VYGKKDLPKVQTARARFRRIDEEAPFQASWLQALESSDPGLKLMKTRKPDQN